VPAAKVPLDSDTQETLGLWLEAATAPTGVVTGGVRPLPVAARVSSKDSPQLEQKRLSGVMGPVQRGHSIGSSTRTAAMARHAG